MNVEHVKQMNLVHFGFFEAFLCVAFEKDAIQSTKFGHIETNERIFQIIEPKILHYRIHEHKGTKFVLKRKAKQKVKLHSLYVVEIAFVVFKNPQVVWIRC